MTAAPSAIWAGPLPEEARDRLREILRPASGRHDSLKVFFRADDIALADDRFSRMMHIFRSHKMPICLAVVPDWLDRERWEAMREFEPGSDLWCWHQHGRSHTNHERAGKKCEFGDSRSRGEISRDLADGRKHLTEIMGNLFCPVFTPPWNRCGLATLELLREQGFQAVSRSENAKPSARGILPDLAVNIDLHTRRENTFREGWRNLLAEFAEAGAGGRMGIMLHHQRMNDHALAFIDLLLGELSRSSHIPCTFRELLPLTR